MKEKYTLSELKKIYNAPEFVEKIKQISNMPIKGVEYLYKHINLIIETHGGDIQGKEYDPYNILVMVDKGENLVDDETLYFLMTSVPKTDDDDDVMEYWGEKAIEKHCPKACFTYMSFLMARGLRPERKLAAYRWAKCSEEFGMMLDLTYSIFVEEFPGSFETGITLIEENLEEEILIDLFDTAQEKQDYSIYFLIIFIMQKRGIDFDKNQLKDICIKANVESFYYFITDEKLPKDKDFDAVYSDYSQMIEFANEVVEKVQKEIYLRTLYEYCEKYMDSSLKFILGFAIDTIKKRKDYKNKYFDLAVIVHAGYNEEKESNDLDFLAQLEEFYRKICAQILMSSMSAPNTLDSPVDKERLKQALYFDEKSQAKLLSSKNIATFDENNYNFDLEVKDGDVGGGYIVYETKITIPQHFESKRIDFYGLSITKTSNMIGEGLIRTLSNDTTKVEIKGTMRVGTSSYPVHFDTILDLPIDKVLEFKEVETHILNVEYVGENTFVDFWLRFNPYNIDSDYYEKDEYYDEDEEYEDEYEYNEEKDFGETEYNGKCSAFVKFDNGKCYEYNNDDGYIKVGDRVIVSGKLAGVMGTVVKLGWYRDGDFMQTIIENYGSDCEFDIKQNDSANMVKDTQNDSCQIYGRLVKDANSKTNCSANSINTKSIPKINNKKKYIIFSIVAAIILFITIISVVVGTANKFKYWESLSSNCYVVEGCTKKSVKEITIKGTHKGKPVSIGDNAFKGMYNLESVIIEDGVTEIGDYAFKDCENLISITIPNSVTSIGDWAFQGCESLVSINIPENVTKIGKGAFYNCSSLTSVTIPDGITTIKSRMFYGCKSLESITIPSSMTSIEDGVFDICSSLNKVNITNIATWCKIRFYRWDSNPLFYAKNLYLNDNLVTNLTIPNSVKTISKYAFYNCKSIKNVTIPNSVTSIEESAFAKCNLTKIMIPDSVTALGNSVFDKCGSLAEVSIGSGLTNISAYTFQDCISLKNIAIPNNITSIGGLAFKNCSNLNKIIIPNSVNSIGASAFDGCSNLTIYCEIAEKPNGWLDNWNPLNRPVEWGYIKRNLTI